MNRDPFSIGEWYHCYNRGVDKRNVFEDSKDYDRFLSLLYVCNGKNPVHISNLSGKTFKAIVSDTTVNRGRNLVEMGAYCLMRNHVHLLLKETEEGGIARFMQKVGTGYTMYFNKKRDRTGALFSGAFKSKHILDDRYLKRVVPYIHFNPINMATESVERAQSRLLKFPYSSFQDFMSPNKRPEYKLLSQTIFELFDQMPPMREQLEEARAYSQELSR